MRLGHHQEAITLYNQALKIEPEDLSIQTNLAFAYLFAKEMQKSQELFLKINAHSPNNPDILAGLGYIQMLNGNEKEAENYFNQALQADPKHLTTRIYLGTLRLRQKRPEEAKAIFTKLQTEDPDNPDIKEGLLESTPKAASEETSKETAEEKLLREKTEKETKLLKIIKKLREKKKSQKALPLAEKLHQSSPENSDYTLLLGSIYVEIGKREEALALYKKALEKKRDGALLKAMGFIYLNKSLEKRALYPFTYLKKDCNFAASKKLFEEVIQLNPHDADALAGLGRLFLLKDNEKTAQTLYEEALFAEPENNTALIYLASLQSQQKKYYTAEKTYRFLLNSNPQDKEVRNLYRFFLRDKKTFLEQNLYYEEENEKDPDTQEWLARLKNYGGSLGFGTPLKDKFKFLSQFSLDYIELKNLLSGATVYSVESKKLRLGLHYQLSAHLFMSGGISLTYFDHYHPADFTTSARGYCQPYFNITYLKKGHTFSFESVEDTPLVARDFVTKRSTLIARQFLNGHYEYDLGKQRTVGAYGTYGWYYNCIRNNQFQSFWAYCKLTPPKYWENISLTYLFKYARFSDLTIDYYTFQPQISHCLKVDISKKWKDEHLITEAGYQHCWQRSFEQGQPLLVTPTLPFFHWIERRIHGAYARLRLNPNERININITATYSHDNFDYTTASISANFNLKF